MAHLIKFPTFVDHRGTLTVMDQDLPFVPRRCFTVYGMKEPRGGHGHLVSRTILFALAGSFKVEVSTQGTAKGSSDFYTLDDPCMGLYLDPQDWHQFEARDSGSVLLCIASHAFSKDDYFYEKP